MNQLESKLNSIKPLRVIVILAIILLNISCDQVSKKIAREELNYHERIEVLDEYLVLTKVENTGAFLSLGNELPRWIYVLLMIVMPAIVLGYGFYYLLQKHDLSLRLIVGISFIIGGGIGNIYDRILYGSVTDFMHMDFVIFRTGIFNMADLSVMVGLGIILLDSFMKKKKTLPA